MKLEQSFDVRAPIERVWSALIDIERVAPCLPGAEVTGREPDGSYAGAFTVKIGPTTAAYTGRLEMVSLDEQAHTATMSADGSDRRGQGGARATIVSSLSERDGVTHVEVDTDYTITGRLARFGRGGMIEDIAERLLRQFAERLQASLAEEGPARPAQDEQPAGAEDGRARAAEPGPPPVAAEPGPPPVAAAPDPPPVAAAPPPPVEPLDAGSLITSVALARLRRNPLPVLAAALLLALVLGRRRRQD